MKKWPFVNRVDELRDLKAKLTDQSWDKILVVLGGSGIGKSRLTEEACGSLECPCLRIRSRNIGANQLEEGNIVRRLTAAVNENANELKTISLQSFYRTHLRKNIKINLLKSIGLSAASFVPGGAELYKAGEKAVNDYLEDPSLLIQGRSGLIDALCDEYITYVSKTAKFVSVIENAHQADAVSLEYLITKLSKMQRVILEFTTNNPQGLELADFLRSYPLETGRLEIYPIERLPVQEAIHLLEEDGNSLALYAASAYQNSDGSLRSISDAVALQSQGKLTSTLLERSSEGLMESLSPNEKLIATLLVMRGEPVPADELFDCIANSGANNPIDALTFRACLEHLSVQIIEPVSLNNFIIQHDQLSSAVIQLPSYSKYRFIAIKFWKQFFDDRILYIDGRQLDGYLINACKFSILIGDFEKLDEYLPKLADLTLRAIDPSAIGMVLIEGLRLVKESGTLKEATFARIVKSCYTSLFSVGLSEQTLAVLEFADRSSLPLAYEALCHSRLNNFDGALAALDRFSENEDKPTEGKKLMFLALDLLINRYSRTSQETFDLFNRRLEAWKRSDHVSLGFLLRSANICHSPSQAIPHLEASAQHFANRGDTFQESISLISLSTRQAISGEFERARKTLRYSEKCLESFPGIQYIFLNNLGCYDIIEGNVNPATFDYFEQAMFATRDPYAKCALNINKLIACCFGGDIAACNTQSETLASMLGKGPFEANLQGHAHYALYLAAVFAKNPVEAEFHRSELSRYEESVEGFMWKAVSRGVGEDLKSVVDRRAMIYPAVMGFWTPDFMGKDRYLE